MGRFSPQRQRRGPHRDGFGGRVSRRRRNEARRRRADTHRDREPALRRESADADRRARLRRAGAPQDQAQPAPGYGPQRSAPAPGGPAPRRRTRPRNSPRASSGTPKTSGARSSRPRGRATFRPGSSSFAAPSSPRAAAPPPAVGPFYCSQDRAVYLDTAFFNELSRRFKAPGDFAQAYVIAHEIGHHVQNLTGTMQQVDAQMQRQDERGRNALSVRLELQADCYAGVWGYFAQKRNVLDAGDLEEGFTAASAIGDDQIQKRTQGYVVPESFTHGTAEQRLRWFKTGLASGDMRRCDTFASGGAVGPAVESADGRRRSIATDRRWSARSLPRTGARHRAARCSKASTSTTRCSANARAPRSGISTPATGWRSSTWPRPHRLLRPAGAGDRRPHRARVPLRRTRGAGGDALWEQVKLHFIALLIDHKQPECAETFFNSVSVKILRRGYFHNRFIFVRPAISTEHIDADPPSYRSYYPLQQGLRPALIDIVLDFGFERRFADFGRDLAQRARRVPQALPAAVRARGEPPDPGAVVAVLPQPDGLHRRAHRQRHPYVSVRRADQARRAREGCTSTRC